ncbi:MAG: hypothetical protein JXB13_00785 [Phycisphaerae bacterium]|nr:hypothetical protein [Phycisphaerae bacterium]
MFAVLLVVCPWRLAGGVPYAGTHQRTTDQPVSHRLEALVSETLPVFSADRSARLRNATAGVNAMGSADAGVLPWHNAMGIAAILETPGKLDRTADRSLFSLHCLLTL